MEENESPDQGLGRKALQLANWILDKAIEGVPPLRGPEDLAAEYSGDPDYASVEERVKALVRWEAAKNFGSGFVTGLGGLLTFPVAIPAALGASWVLQARLAAATAVLHGHSLKEDRVRTLVLLAILGDSAKDLAKGVGLGGEPLTLDAVRGIPGRVLLELNKRVGIRLLAKAGQRGAASVARAVPLVGGLIGGAVDAAMCAAVGEAAERIFGKEPRVVEAEIIPPKRRAARKRAAASASATRRRPKPAAARAGSTEATAEPGASARTTRGGTKKVAARKKTGAPRAPRARRTAS
jgi:hypothetical protein